MYTPMLAKLRDFPKSSIIGQQAEKQVQAVSIDDVKWYKVAGMNTTCAMHL